MTTQPSDLARPVTIFGRDGHHIQLAEAPKLISISVTPTLDTSAYASGDNLGTNLSFVDATLTALLALGRPAFVHAVTVLDKSVQAAPMDLFLYNSAPAGGGNNNAAFDPDDADLLLMAPGGCVHITDWQTNNDNCQGIANNLLRSIAPAAAGTFYGRLVVRGTPTYAVGDLTVVVTVMVL